MISTTFTTSSYVHSKMGMPCRPIQCLPFVFKKPVRLQTLFLLYSVTKPGRKLDWMSPRQRKVFLPLLHLPTLTSISLLEIQTLSQF
ncbi:hypothetical protein BYT27DRAFT_6667555 [Phlegmacium glaucopus]|nr:hypothetical protein BYT27DRAFT_6667555 [Phlegmacium glaucopus]